MQERGLSAYLAELIGTFLLVFFITSVVVLFVATGDQAQFGTDFAVVGLVHAFLLFGLIVMFGVVSGGHFNPAVTLAAAALKRISPADAAIYMLAQLSGGVLGALLCKGLLLNEGRASHYGAASVSPMLGSNFRGLDRRGDRHLLPGARDPRGRLLQKELQGVGAAGDRHDPGLHRHGRRPADRRFLQPGPLVRPGAGRQRMGAASGPTWSARSSARCSRPPSSSSCSRPVARRRPSRLSRSKRLRRSRSRRRSPSRRSPAPSRPSPAAVSRRARRPGGPHGSIPEGIDPVASAACGGSPSHATTRSPSRAPASATASTAPSPPTGRTSTRPRRSRRGSTRRSGATPRSCWSSPASGPRSTPRSPRASRSGATTTSPPTSSGPASGRWSAASCRTRTSAS